IGQHLQPCEVFLERPWLVQINIEAKKVYVPGRKKFGGGKRGKCAKRRWVGRLGFFHNSSMKRVTRATPLQRTISAGISLTTLRPKTAGWSLHAAAAWRTASRACCWIS